jgi:phosphoribosyl 1,2-cyclic phosphate phosphodiesterase
MLRENVKHLEAVLFTHEHKDHIAGMDDIRAFNYKSRQDMPIYANEQTQIGIKREFHYVFSGFQYPGIPKVVVNTIDKSSFDLFGKTIQPIEVMHYKLPVLGFRIDNFTYITDANYIAPEELDKLRGTEILVLNALRLEPHISHFTLQEALDLIAEIKPKKAYLTHVSHLLGSHDKVSANLPENVELAYDGLTIEC